MARLGVPIGVLACAAAFILATMMGGAKASAQTVSSRTPDRPEQGTVCFIVRTYWGHGDTWGDKSLRRLLESLQNQTVQSWEALLVVMDNRPFPELRRIVGEINDQRIWVHAEWVNYKYNPKEGGVWAPTYHNKLYNVTDNAIRACPSQAKWVVVTNGDNVYDAAFVETVYAAPADADAVAIDFYSRYQRPTANPCERFEEGEGAPACKENGMRFCHTDLAANAYRLERLLAEDRRFGLVDPGGSAGANDGIMAQLLRAAGWKIHYVHGRCLIMHSPNPQQCALSGGTWDDSIMCQATSFGGACVSAKSVLERMRMYPDMYELVEINVTYDRNSFSFGAFPHLELKCLRLANRSLWYQAQTFGRVCAARVDFKALPTNLPPHPWDNWVVVEDDAGSGHGPGAGRAAARLPSTAEDGPEEWNPVAGERDESTDARDEL